MHQLRFGHGELSKSHHLELKTALNAEQIYCMTALNTEQIYFMNVHHTMIIALNFEMDQYSQFVVTKFGQSP